MNVLERIWPKMPHVTFDEIKFKQKKYLRKMEVLSIKDYYVTLYDLWGHNSYYQKTISQEKLIPKNKKYLK